MGFNIAAAVVDRCYFGNIEELEKEWNSQLKFIGEISFEDAVENWKEEGVLDFYFTKSGTLILRDVMSCTDFQPLPSSNVLSFILLESSMAFSFAYSEGIDERRKLVFLKGKLNTNIGLPLTIEADEDDVSEIIWKQVKVLLGKSFFEIDLNERAYRYKKI